MPIDDLTALGDALRAARKEKNLTQEQLADESHVSTKQIADIEKARRNPSYLILKALAKVVHLSLDSLMYPDLSPDEAGQNEMKLLYMNCPPEMRETLLHHTRGFAEELKAVSYTHLASDFFLFVLLGAHRPRRSNHQSALSFTSIILYRSGLI